MQVWPAGIARIRTDTWSCCDLWEQVDLDPQVTCHNLRITHTCGVPYPTTIHSSWTSCLSSPHGIPLPSFVFILNSQSMLLTPQQLDWVVHCKNSSQCAEFVTWDLPSEEAAWGWWKAAKAKVKPTMPLKWKGKEEEALMGKKKKNSTIQVFSFSCYKPHSLGNYAKTIQLFGTYDGYSTQTVHILEYLSSHLLLIINFWQFRES